jgi:hypothetical protein
MKLLIIAKFGWIALARRTLRQVTAFPLIALFGVTGIALIGIGLVQIYEQSLTLLAALPGKTRSFVNVKLFSTVICISFLLAYMFLALLREPSRDQPTFAATPVPYSQLWLGVNAVALFLILLGMTGLVLPIVAAMAHTSWPKPTPPGIIISSAIGISLCLAFRSVSLAVCVERVARLLFLSIPFRTKMQPFLGILLPLTVTVLLGLPLTYPELRYVDPLADSLASWLSDPGPVQTIALLIWAITPVLVVLSAVRIMLDYTFEDPFTATPSSLLSKIITPTGNVYSQFIFAEIKRLLRQKALVSAYLLLVGVIAVWIYGLRRYTDAGSSALSLMFQVMPYLGLAFPLVTLHQDLSSEWYFRSIPMQRVVYLGLKLMAASLLSLGLAAMLMIVLCINGVLPTMTIAVETSARTLGMAGLAFLIGGVLRMIMGDVAGQVFASFVCFALGAGLQYGISQIVHLLSPMVANVLAIAMFGVAPFAVLAWENWSGTEM